MALYTVKSGDNLTKIAQQYGIGIENITGYRSGNPNLIFPGETLTINTQPVAPVQPSPQPVQQPQPPQNVPGSPTPQVTPTPVAQPSPAPQPAPQPIQQQVQQPVTGGALSNISQQVAQQTATMSPAQLQAGAQTPVQPTTPAPQPTPQPVQPQALPTTEELIQDYLNRPDSQTSPSATFEDIYNKVSEKLNLASDKAGIETSAKEIEKLKIELGDKIAEINSNPWLSEGKRQKSVSLMQEKYQGREDALINRLRLQESVYNRNAENARFAATQAFDFVQQQQTGERQQAQLEQNQFQFLIEQAQKVQEAKRKLNEIEPGRYKEVQGGLYDVKEGKFVVQPKTTIPKSSGFTRTQIDKGASRAGLSRDEFTQLNTEIKNYYINKSQSQIDAINDSVKNVKAGKEKAEDVISEIDNSTNTDTVKEHLKQRINEVAPLKSTEGYWQRFKNFIGIK